MSPLSKDPSLQVGAALQRDPARDWLASAASVRLTPASTRQRLRPYSRIRGGTCTLGSHLHRIKQEHKVSVVAVDLDKARKWQSYAGVSVDGSVVRRTKTVVREGLVASALAPLETSLT